MCFPSTSVQILQCIYQVNSERMGLREKKIEHDSFRSCLAQDTASSLIERTKDEVLGLAVHVYCLWCSPKWHNWHLIGQRGNLFHDYTNHYLARLMQSETLLPVDRSNTSDYSILIFAWLCTFPSPEIALVLVSTKLWIECQWFTDFQSHAQSEIQQILVFASYVRLRVWLCTCSCRSLGFLALFHPSLAVLFLFLPFLTSYSSSFYPRWLGAKGLTVVAVSIATVPTLAGVPNSLLATGTRPLCLVPLHPLPLLACLCIVQTSIADFQSHAQSEIRQILLAENTKRLLCVFWKNLIFLGALQKERGQWELE